MMSFEVNRAREWFDHGLPLIRKVDRELAIDLELFSRGGIEILKAIEQQDYDVLKRRPSISKPRKLRAYSSRRHWEAESLMISTARDIQPGSASRKTSSLQLRAAYAVCRSIARSAAKNFYYGFLALPAL